MLGEENRKLKKKCAGLEAREKARIESGDLPVMAALFYGLGCHITCSSGTETKRCNHCAGANYLQSLNAHYEFFGLERHSM